MYKALIVDDEGWIRRGLRAKLAKHGFQFSWIGEAADGEEALRLMHEHDPEVVLLDVRMDGMDGLELMRQARKLSRQTKFIVISGHSEFEYAERAINEGARGYLLKPIESRLFVKRLQAVIIELDQERTADASIEETLSARIIASNRDRLDGMPAEGNAETAAWMARPDSESSRTQGPYYALGIIHPDNSGYRNWVYEVRAKESFLAHYAAVLQPVFQPRAITLLEDKRHAGDLIFLCSDASPQRVKSIAETASSIACTRAGDMGQSVSVGCSPVEESVTRELYEKARHALNSRLIHGAGRVYSYSRAGETAGVDEQDLRFLEQYVRHADLAEIRRQIERILRASRRSGDPVAYLRQAWISIVDLVAQALSSGGPPPGEELAPLTEDVFDLVDSVDQLCDHLCGRVERALSGRLPGHRAGEEDRIAEICRYIDRHFASGLSTHELASRFNMNANYLSTLFHQRAGLTVMGYISHVRMNAACRLLAETTMSVARVAETVGFTDPKYFHRVFKTTKGVTPGEYRQGS